MKYNLKLLLFFLGILLAAIPAKINTAMAQQSSVNLPSSQLVAQSQNTEARELRAFSRSKYDYWDARVLADYWGQSIGDAKARVGRKVLWGEADIAILEQFLVDARAKGLNSTPEKIVKFYSESKYTYADAEKLAKFWGDKSPYDAKLRIGRNLILGQDEVVEKAMGQAKRRR